MANALWGWLQGPDDKEEGRGTCLYGQCARHHGVDPVTEGVKLLVTATQDVVLKQVSRPAVELKQGHVELHGEI